MCASFIPLCIFQYHSFSFSRIIIVWFSARVLLFIFDCLLYISNGIKYCAKTKKEPSEALKRTIRNSKPDGLVHLGQQINNQARLVLLMNIWLCNGYFRLTQIMFLLLSFLAITSSNRFFARARLLLIFHLQRASLT